MKTRIIVSAGLIVSLLAGGALALSNQNTTKVNADASTTVSSNFMYDYENSTYGTLDTSSYQRILSNGSTNINNVPLTLWDGETQDTNIDFKFSGNNSSYAKGNYIRGRYNGYLQARYPSSVNDDGGTIYIAPNNISYKITSITVSLHERCFQDGGESYNHISVNGVDTYETVAELGYSSSNLSKTWTDNDGISSFSFGISLKQSTVNDKEKYLIFGSVNVTYVAVSNVSLVTFNTQGGSEIESQYVKNGNCATRPETDPVKQTSGLTKYTFDDWYTSADGNELFDFSSSISADTTIYAHWIESVADTYTMTFESNGGTTVNSITTYEGAPFTKPADPTRSTSNVNKYAFSFSGWYTDSGLTTAYDWSTLASDDIVLYAKWHFDVIDNVPSVRNHYTINNGAQTWASTDHYTNDTYYQDITLNSRETFDSAASKEEINIHIVSTDSSHGFYVHKVYSILVRNANLTISSPDSTKVITYVRFDFGNWGETTYTMSLYPNDSTAASDTDTLPNPTEITHTLEASFNANDSVKSVRLNVGNHLVVMQNLYLVFAEDPVLTAAENYASAFNDANVCGVLDTDGLDIGKWNLQADAYSELDSAVQSYLTNYSGSSEEIVNCLERYDRVVYLYGEDYDFMGRIAAGKVTPRANNTGIFQMNNALEYDNLVIIIVIATTSLLTLSCFIIIKKRKTSN